jgi:hypothetical protein
MAERPNVTRQELIEFVYRNMPDYRLLPWQIEVALAFINGDNVSWFRRNGMTTTREVVDKFQGMHADMFIVDETHGLGET